MKEPLISIITVTYNAEEVLEQTLRNVAEQTFRDFEHIIVDGASTDSTLSIASRYAGSNLQIHSKPDQGIYHGMNRGLKFARGKYVVFLNAGDKFATPDTLAHYASAAEDDPDIIYGDTAIIDGDGRIVRMRHLRPPEKLTYKSYLKGMLVCHQAFMVKRTIAPEYDRTFRLSADYDWCLECISRTEAAKCRNLAEITIHYLDGGMSEKKKRESLKERFDIMHRRFGLPATIVAHLSFIPRALKRRLGR